MFYIYHQAPSLFTKDPKHLEFSTSPSEWDKITKSFDRHFAADLQRSVGYHRAQPLHVLAKRLQIRVREPLYRTLGFGAAVQLEYAVFRANCVAQRRRKIAHPRVANAGRRMDRVIYREKKKIIKQIKVAVRFPLAAKKTTKNR